MRKLFVLAVAVICLVAPSAAFAWSNNGKVTLISCGEADANLNKESTPWALFVYQDDVLVHTSVPYQIGVNNVDVSTGFRLTDNGLHTVKVVAANASDPKDAGDTRVALVDSCGPLAGTPGPQGVKGDKGDTGATGATGAPGRDGKDGLDAKDGQDGRSVDVRVNEAGCAELFYANQEVFSVLATICNGKDGVNGTNGTNGTNGVDGANGRDGAPGTPGAQGNTGDAGKQGLTGKQGKNGKAGKNGKNGKTVVVTKVVKVGPKPEAKTLLPTE